MGYDIKNFTLEEKLNLLCGVGNWNLETANGKLPKFTMHDGPSGLRKVANGATVPATSMPTISVLANTWNRELARLDGQTIADECVENDTDLLLAPGVNIKRSPLCGRNFEYFSEDPYQAGVLAKEFILGVQEKGVGTSLKHFCLNNRETFRALSSSEIDERAMREIYTRAFEIAIEAKPWTIMCSYNKVNGVYAGENKWLLKDILRDKLGFDGLIVSDWSAIGGFYRAIKATLNLIMPHHEKCFENLLSAYNDGLLTDQEIDYAVEHILQLIEKAKTAKKAVQLTKEQRHDNAVKIAEEGMVLLKNDGALPVKSGKVLVNHFGNFAIGGGGSSCVKTEYKQESIVDLLNENAKGNAKFEYCYAHLCALEEVYGADAIIITVSCPTDTEAADRDNIRLSKYDEDMIIETAKYNKNVIVNVIGGSAMDMSAWIDSVNAVIFCGYAGEGFTQALANIITGKVCPSGKLSETFPMSLEDTFTVQEHGNGQVEWYNDGIFVGYRYYDSANVDVLFPYGYGLSYAKFSYSNLKITKEGETDFIVSYDITNESEFDAKEVSQIYVKDVISSVIRPEKELKGFSKDLIKAGQTKTVKVKLDKNAFAFYSIPADDWHVENGWFEIMVGSSSRDIKLVDKLQIKLPEYTQFTKVSTYYR